MTSISILICSHGDEKWQDLAMTRAWPSTEGQGAEVDVLHEPDCSLTQTRNLAASHATADWLCFLDADDELAPGYMNAMRAAIGRYETASTWPPAPPLFAPAVEYVMPNGVRTEPAIPNRSRWPDMNECVIGTLVDRRQFMRVGWFRELPSLEDYDLWLRCVKEGATIVHVPDAVYVAHVNPNGGRNTDQTILPRLREEHAEVWGH